MKQLFILIALISSFNLSAQETKKVKNKAKGLIYKEEFYVLKSDAEVKHGNFKRLYKGDVIVNGYYNNGQKDSIWTEYHLGSGSIKRKGKFKKGKKEGTWIDYANNADHSIVKRGQYSNGQRIGVWEFYNQDSELTQRYDYDKRELVFYKPKEDEEEYFVLIEGESQKMKLDRPPLYIGDKAALYSSFIEESDFKYPKMAKRLGVSGVVWVTFIVDVDGKAKDIMIARGIGAGCDEESIRLVKSLSDNWIPGILNGEKVKVRYTIPITFKLE